MVASKYVDSETLNYIAVGQITKLAKANTGFWADVKAYDSLVLTDGAREVIVKVDKIGYFGDFGEAWFTEGEQILFPYTKESISTMAEANSIYKRFHPPPKDPIGIVVATFHFIAMYNFNASDIS